VHGELRQTKRELGELRSVSVEDAETRVKAAERLPGTHVLDICPLEVRLFFSFSLGIICNFSRDSVPGSLMRIDVSMDTLPFENIPSPFSV